MTLLCESRRGYANLCRILTDAHARHAPARARARAARAARRASRCSRRTAEGLVCLSGCARHGLAVVDPAAAATARPRLSRAPSTSSSSAPSSAATRAATRALCELAASLGVATVATGDVHSHHPRRARLQDALVAIRTRSSLDGCERERRGNHESVLRSPAESAERLPRRRGRPHPRGRRALRLRPHPGARLPLPGLLRRLRPGRAAAARDLRARVRRRATATRPRRPGADAGAARDRARADRAARARRLLPAALGGARAGPRAARSRCGAPTRRATCCRRGGGAARASARSSATSPASRTSIRWRRTSRSGRFLNDELDLGARHRPRLPARHPREAHRPAHRPLRPRARRAGGELRHLPQPRRDPRPRQGARPARGRARAARARHRRLERAGASPRSSTASRAATAGRAGGPSASSPARSPACRATSPSTPAAW